jgi:hypothetical protein
MASSPRKQPVTKEKASPGEGKASSGEGSGKDEGSDYVAPSSEDEESVSEKADSDYEPDEGFKPKRAVAAASRSSGRRGAKGSAGSQR